MAWALANQGAGSAGSIPARGYAGQQPGYVRVAFVSPGNEEGWLWFSVTEGVQARENGLTGGALLEALHYQQVGLTAEPEADVTTQTPGPDASSDTSDLDACAAYLDLEVSFNGGGDRRWSPPTSAAARTSTPQASHPAPRQVLFR